MKELTTRKQQIDKLIEIFIGLNLGTRIEDHLWDTFVDEDKLPLPQDKFDLVYDALKEAAHNIPEY